MLTHSFKTTFKTTLICVGLTTLAHAAHAQPGHEDSRPDWSVSLGTAAVYSPMFQGSDDYAVSLFPDVRVNYKDEFFASIPEGIGYRVLNGESFKAGPIVKLRFGRDESDGGSPFLISGNTDALRGLGDVDAAGEAGAFIEYHLPYMRARLEGRQGFGGHEGVLMDAELSYVNNYRAVRYSLGPRLSWASSDFMNTYFGVTPGQAASSGIAQDRVGSGILSYGIGGAAMMPVAKNTVVTLFANAERLGDEVADSNFIRQRGSANQATVGLGVSYRLGLD